MEKTKKKKFTPPNAGKGRPKGVPNKTTKKIKDAMLEALNHGKGATDFFVKLKENDPRTFAACITKLLPLQMNAELNANVNQTAVFKLEYVNPEEESDKEAIEVETDDSKDN